MNELTGKDKAIAQALTTYGYYEVSDGGEAWTDDGAAWEESPEDIEAYLADRRGIGAIHEAFKNWIITDDLDCLYVQQLSGQTYWFKFCEEHETAQIFRATVSLVRGTATAWDEAQGQLNLFEGENYAIAPTFTAVN